MAFLEDSQWKWNLVRLNSRLNKRIDRHNIKSMAETTIFQQI